MVGEVWSEAAWSVWGKTDRESNESLPLVQHLEDTAGVVGFIWDTWTPPIVRQRLGEELGGVSQARTLLCFLGGVHDIGKASPAFAQLAYEVGMDSLVSVMERAGLRSPRLPRAERERHTLTGHVALEEWLRQVHGFSPGRASALASIVSAHHGTPASSPAELTRVRNLTRSMGDDAWDEVRHEILDRMARVTGAVPVLQKIRDTKLSLHVLIDLSALVIVADWIASDTTRFPYDLATPGHRLSLATGRLDLRAPWLPREPTGARELFRERFPHLSDLDPSSLQVAAYEAASSADAPPLMVIEAPTGAGKSEAALMAAEVLAAKFGAGGIYIGLPTMATSNAMFGRVLRWLTTWPGSQDPTMWLAHGKAALNEDFADLVRDSRVHGVFDEDTPSTRGPSRVSGWLAGRKKGLLANVVVGTIDQVLMGALQARHLALRHLALSGKVVVVDEVHATDVYMRSYLVRMLDYLGGYGTPVILLSATLPPDQREELTAAYQAGRARRAQPTTGGLRSRRRHSQPAEAPLSGSQPEPPGPDVYPVLTVSTDSVRHIGVAHEDRFREVLLEPLQDDGSVLVERLTQELSGGGCVAVIRNTVRRAQETFDTLREVFGDDVELFHSRFLASDRAVRERLLVDRLGPASDQRPRRLVIVGTQVLEQSLDIDLDLLITDVAPVDLMIQRIGRLHRHARPLADRPEPLRSARCLVAGVVDWQTQPPQADPGSRRVYDQALLIRSLAVLSPHLRGEPLRLADGPFLVHRAYDPDLEPPQAWEEAWRDADLARAGRDSRSRSKAVMHQVPEPGNLTSLTSWTATPLEEPREDTGRAQVRDSEDGIEVIVLYRDQDGHLRLLPGGHPGADHLVPLDPVDGDRITRHIAASTVSLPQALTNPGRWDDTVRELESEPVVDTWQRSRWLAGQLVLVLDHDLQTTLNGHEVTYDPGRGLDVVRLETKGTT